ncbi:uncharacterized protein LOC122502374 [Leptopilina heterotoma]|uniref:uncharacterized protein LOC122502374 n=1 Tax=Leptopilina heterotoma TaxID=63436 RepID=UPI001CA996D3|nr:uncharacterized protein LOC122502374 [Leptopilina heterotoma]
MKRIEQNIYEHPKSFWSFVNNTNKKPPLPDTMFYNNQSLDSPQLIVNAIANLFASINCGIFLQTHQSVNFQSISDQENVTEFFTPNLIIKAAKSLKSNSTAGLDGIPSFLVKDCITTLAFPLSYIFNIALNTATFPRVWKTAKVIPVFKSGDKTDCKNYRPIAIIPNFAKIFEFTIKQTLNNAIKSIVSENQHGCITKRSTTTNLAIITHFITKSLQLGYQVDVIYLDFAKAFDSIDHTILGRSSCDLALVH